MTYIERNTVYQSEEFVAQVRMALADWINYWATNGTDSIEDPDLREKTDMYIKFCASNMENYTRSLATLVIGEQNVAEAEEITDAVVKTAVTHVLATALEYLI